MARSQQINRTCPQLTHRLNLERAVSAVSAVKEVAAVSVAGAQVVAIEATEESVVNEAGVSAAVSAT
jgi:hypothetical protein